MTLSANWQRQSGEQRTEEYRSWRTVLGVAGVSDVDQIEYRFHGNDIVPVAVVELCVADRKTDEIPMGVDVGRCPSPRFFDAVLHKVSDERPQGRVLRLLSYRLGVPLLVVVYVDGRLETGGVWVHRDGKDGWEHMTLNEYGARLGRFANQRSTP